jgi:putative hydrolase of the HAD superfamily
VIRAVLFDALGTLVHLEPPAPRLQRSLATRLALDVPLDRCEAAMRAELRYYGEHCIRARDGAALAVLRLECADVLADVLAVGPNGPELLPCLTDALVFTAFPDSAPALTGLADAGRRLAVVSNWDVSLPPTLARLGLLAFFELVVHAAEVGASKPDPRPFEVALERLGLPAAECVHVGDDPVTDGEGARAAGITALIVDRTGRTGDAGAMASLLDLPARLAALEQAA